MPRARVLFALLLAGCGAGPSRYVIIRVPPAPVSVKATAPWPPRDDSDAAPQAFCEAACARYARGAERTRECRLLNVAKYALGVRDGVVCAFE